MFWTSVVSFSRSLESFPNSPVFRRGWFKNPPNRRNTQKQHLQNSEQNLTKKQRKKFKLENTAEQLLKNRLSKHHEILVGWETDEETNDHKTRHRMAWYVEAYVWSIETQSKGKIGHRETKAR